MFSKSWLVCFYYFPIDVYNNLFHSGVVYSLIYYDISCNNFSSVHFHLVLWLYITYFSFLYSQVKFV